jgi:hypothetical protein
MWRVEPVALRVRIENADERLARGTLYAELEVIERRAREQARGSFGQILLADTTEVGSCETLL